MECTRTTVSACYSQKGLRHCLMVQFSASDEEIEAQRGQVTCSGLHSELVAQLSDSHSVALTSACACRHDPRVCAILFKSLGFRTRACSVPSPWSCLWEVVLPAPPLDPLPGGSASTFSSWPSSPESGSPEIGAPVIIAAKTFVEPHASDHLTT